MLIDMPPKHCSRTLPLSLSLPFLLWVSLAVSGGWCWPNVIALLCIVPLEAPDLKSPARQGHTSAPRAHWHSLFLWNHVLPLKIKLGKYITIADSISIFCICSSRTSEDIVSCARSVRTRSSSVLLFSASDCWSSLCLICFPASWASSKSVFILSNYKEMSSVLQMRHFFTGQ